MAGNRHRLEADGFQTVSRHRVREGRPGLAPGSPLRAQRRRLDRRPAREVGRDWLRSSCRRFRQGEAGATSAIPLPNHTEGLVSLAGGHQAPTGREECECVRERRRTAGQAGTGLDRSTARSRMRAAATSAASVAPFTATILARASASPSGPERIAATCARAAIGTITAPACRP